MIKNTTFNVIRWIWFRLNSFLVWLLFVGGDASLSSLLSPSHGVSPGGKPKLNVISHVTQSLLFCS